MKLKPFRNRILAQAEDEQENTTSGLVLITNPNSHNRARILAIGPGLVNKKGVRIPVTVKPNDIVLYDPNSIKPIIIDESEFLVLKEEDIVAVIDE